MADLFQQGDFMLHSGERSAFKIECDSFTTADWETLAAMVAGKHEFGAVYGVPQGGIPLAVALHRYATFNAEHPLLIVDDVLTTGASMEHMKNEVFGDIPNEFIGVVVFARGECPDWIHPIFRMWG